MQKNVKGFLGQLNIRELDHVLYLCHGLATEGFILLGSETTLPEFCTGHRFGIVNVVGCDCRGHVSGAVVPSSPTAGSHGGAGDGGVGGAGGGGNDKIADRASLQSVVCGTGRAC